MKKYNVTTLYENNLCVGFRMIESENGIFTATEAVHYGVCTMLNSNEIEWLDNKDLREKLELTVYNPK